MRGQEGGEDDATKPDPDNLIFRKTSRTKPKPPIPASEIPTYDHVCVLLRAKFDRVRRTR
ncbi:NinE family protein [Yersinia pseudotuberculosis]|nr:NinE family protein [Yersinia pseudotuberculosis]MBO1567244.1 NinE family protein [Yersinia pseudotuberculosis]MBO1604103.1 NinE family protein [Yersinia pseudotuberculosis]